MLSTIHKDVVGGRRAHLSGAASGVLAALAGLAATSSAFADVNFTNFLSAPGLNIVGDAAPTPDGALRLTPAQLAMRGAAWSADKQNVSQGWSTQFQFRISNIGGATDPNLQRGGDGFTFLIQNAGADHLETSVMAGGGGLGYNGMSNVIAFEFDMWKNDRALDQGSNSVSVLSNGVNQLISSELYSIGNSIDIPDMSDGLTHTARIEYVPGTVKVFLDNLESPAISAPLNIGSTLALDNGTAWVGFTGTTGGAWQDQDLLNWKFTPVPAPGAFALGGFGMMFLGRRRRTR